MKRYRALILTAVLAAAVPAAAAAQSINDRQAELYNRIEAGVRSGDLTRQEAQRLRAEFDALTRLETQYRATGGGISDSERRELERQLDDLSRQVRVDRRDGDDRPGRGYGADTPREANLEARIEAGVRSGQLTRAEAQRLRDDFRDLDRLEDQYRATGGGISDSERRDLDRRFDELSRQIRDERRDDDDRRDRPGDYDDASLNERQRNVLQRIERGQRNGNLTRSEAIQLRAEFDAIARIEAQYRASGRGLDRVEREYLDRRFDALERRLREDRRDDDRRWTRLDERQAQFDRQLDQAVRDRQISPRTAASLRAEFRDIARLERQYRNSRPGITPQERTDLNRRFDRMEANFRASVSPTNNLFDLLFGLTR